MDDGDQKENVCSKTFIILLNGHTSSRQYLHQIAGRRWRWYGDLFEDLWQRIKESQRNYT
jgi:hypothetical protein